MSDKNSGNVKPDKAIESESLLILTPKSTLLSKLKEVSTEQLNISEEKIDSLMNTDPQLLINHSVPVLIPSQTSLEDVGSFVSKNHQLLLTLMLTSWPFSINSWGLQTTSMENFEAYVDFKYIPMVYFFYKNAVLSAGPNVPLNEGDQVLLYFAPSDELIDLLDRIVEKHKGETESTEYLERLMLLSSAGVAFISNLPKMQEHQSKEEYLSLIADPRELLRPVTQEVFKLLFSIYFMHQQDWPENVEDKYLDKWFQWKTIVGVYRMSSGTRTISI